MPGGKPAGVRCVQLTDDNRCRLFGSADRPAVCAQLKAEPGMCGASAEEAFHLLAAMEEATRPGPERGELP
jgi:hypothetical protein